MAKNALNNTKWTTNELYTEFQNALGRSPTESELQFLVPYLNKGHLSPYEVGQYLQGTPEAQERQLTSYGKQYEAKLAASDQNILNQAANTIQSQFAQMGRQGSTGQGNALMQAGQNLAMSRQEALAPYYGGGYGNLMGQKAGYGGSALQRGYGQKDAFQQRAWDLQNFYLQKDAYNDYLNRANKGGLGGALGSLAGTAAGAGLGYLAGGYSGGGAWNQGNAWKGAGYGFGAGGLMGGGIGNLFAR